MISLVGCEEDDGVIPQQKSSIANNKSSIPKDIMFDEIMLDGSDLHNENFSLYNQVDRETPGKVVRDSLGNFYYTFLLKNKELPISSNEFVNYSNFVFSTNLYGEILSSYIINYRPSEEWLDSNLYNYKIFSGKMSIYSTQLDQIKEFDFLGGEVIESQYNFNTTSLSSSSPCLNFIIRIQPICTHYLDGSMSCYTIIDVSCSGGNGGSTSGGGVIPEISNSNWNDSSGGGGVDDSPKLPRNENELPTIDDGGFTVPVNTTLNNFTAFKNQLTTEELQIWNILSQSKKDILKVFLENNHHQRDRDFAKDILYFFNVNDSPEAEEFAEEAIKAWNDNSDAEVDFEEEIINELTGKADCIYKKLKQNSTNFSDAINNFDGEFPVSHLNFSINNSLPSGNYGVTNPPNNYMINIEISNTQLSNVSDLGAAIAFVHEVIHAEIFRKMLSAAQTGDLDPGNMTTQQQIDYVNSLRENFPGIYDYYRERYKPTWNHNMMAQHYIEIIADMVEEFDNSSQPRQVYEDISWAGLREIEVLNNSIAWDNLSSTDQSRILNNLSQHFFNGPNNCN